MLSDFNVEFSAAYALLLLTAISNEEFKLSILFHIPKETINNITVVTPNILVSILLIILIFFN